MDAVDGLMLVFLDLKNFISDFIIYLIFQYWIVKAFIIGLYGEKHQFATEETLVLNWIW